MARLRLLVLLSGNIVTVLVADAYAVGAERPVQANWPGDGPPTYSCQSALVRPWPAEAHAAPSHAAGDICQSMSSPYPDKLLLSVTVIKDTPSGDTTRPPEVIT